MTLSATVKRINGKLREEAAKRLAGEEIEIQEESPWTRFSGSWSDESDQEFASYWDEVIRFRRELDRENKMGEFATEGD